MNIVKLCARIDFFYALAVDPIATNKTENSSLPENYFSPNDSLEEYRKKLWKLYYKDIYKVHFDRLVKKNMKLGLSAEDAAHTALKEVEAITTKQCNKSLESHSDFLSHLIDMGVNPGDTVVAPGSGSGDEQVIAPQINWQGLEYQKNLVDLSNQRNQQMGLKGKTDEWSFLKVNPEESLGEEWKEKLNDFPKEIANINAIYGKHACGGITDNALMQAIGRKIPIIFVATCCANRYMEASWRIFNSAGVLPLGHFNFPSKIKDIKKVQDYFVSGESMTYNQYVDLAHTSKRQDDLGKDCIDVIDQMRQDMLEKAGYNVKRGKSEKYGPYIKAWFKNN